LSWAEASPELVALEPVVTAQAPPSKRVVKVKVRIRIEAMNLFIVKAGVKNFGSYFVGDFGLARE